AGEIQPEFVGRTGWSITERGLYRTLRRLASDGLLEVVEVRAARTGAKRKEYSLSGSGSAYLGRLERSVLQVRDGARRRNPG
ncbi:MAG: hypothetical protein ACK5O2_13795, partial [Microthrixaceae bacterium]